MKKVICYVVSVTAFDKSDNVVISRLLEFDDRRKALSYYRKVLDFWNPEMQVFREDKLSQVDVCLTVRYDNGYCYPSFMKSFTY